MVLKAFKFRCFPNRQQRELIAKTFGCCRFVFKQFLAEQKGQDEAWPAAIKQVEAGLLASETVEKRYFRKMDTIKKIPALKADYPFLKEVDSIALQAAVEQLADGYERFYKKQNKQPKFKSKKNLMQSYTTKSVNGNIVIDENRIKLPKLGTIRFAKSREVTGVIKRVFIRQNATGKYFVSVLAETDVQPLLKKHTAIGIDVGLAQFATIPIGEKIKNERYFTSLEQKLVKAQRVLSHRIESAKKRGATLKDAKNVQKQRQKVACIHEKIRNKRNDFLHKLSTTFIKNHDVLCLETLQVKDMLQNNDFSKQIADASWSTFITILRYKADWYGKQIVQVGTFYPSSQLCSVGHTQNICVGSG